MSKIFASGFTSILDDIGCDGYGVDVDAVFEAMKRNDPLHGAPEIETITKHYYSVHFYGRNGIDGYPGAFVPSGGLIEALFNAAKQSDVTKLGGYARDWWRRWIDAHVNLVLNRIYGANRPLIDNFLLLNDGAFDVLIKYAFGGADHAEADKDYPIALLVAERNKGSKLTPVEIANIRTKYYRRTPEELDELKQQLIREIKEEWEHFSSLTTDEILNWR